MGTEAVRSQHRHKQRFVLIALLVALLSLSFLSCGSQHGTGQVVVSPAAVTVTMGANVTFTEATNLQGPAPEDGSLTWAVSPASGGAISGQGVYTTGSTPGDYTVTATWTSHKIPGQSFSGTASLKVLATPQSAAVITPDLVQASGGIQSASAIQNAPILGEPVAAATAADSNGRTQIRHGFSAPISCPSSGSAPTQQPCVPD